MEMRSEPKRITGKSIISLAIMVCLLLLFMQPRASLAWQPQPGDIIFQTSPSSQSLAIHKATHSIWSHVGIVLLKNNQPMVLEASGDVRYTPLQKWIDHGVGKSYVAKRLKQPLSTAQLQALNQQAGYFVGKPYDILFGWSDTDIYCSELVWKMYFRAAGLKIGTVQRIEDFDLSSPAVKKIIKARYGDKLPLNEQVISPVAMFDSPLLETVASVGY